MDHIEEREAIRKQIVDECLSMVYGHILKQAVSPEERNFLTVSVAVDLVRDFGLYFLGQMMRAEFFERTGKLE